MTQQTLMGGVANRIRQPHKAKKVEIVVEAGHHYAESVNNGREYTSVDFMAGRYGMGSPCDTDEEIKSSINHAKEWIKREGDIPVVVDKREKATLNGF